MGIFNEVSSLEKCFIEMLLPAPTRKDRLGGALSWAKQGRANQLITHVSMMDFESNLIIFQIFDMNKYFYLLINVYTFCSKYH
ncbi:MAG TPA: hypothetical protein VK369_14030 [Segetibacter sp.]|nr:hypothetical protein [Segetibacter sp.]